jgi:predicted dehydrogenase
LNEPSAAIIGTGFIGQVHARALRLLGVPLRGVVASTAERSEAAAGHFGVDRVFHDAAALIERSEADTIHVCTPNHLHRPLVEQALAAGKHVICEKPLGISLAEASRLARLAREADRVAAIPFAYRYHAMTREAQARACTGSLGRIHLIHGSYLQDWLLSPGEGGWRVDAAAGGASRAFADIGSHWCDLAEWITGQRIAELVSLTGTVIAERAAAGSGTFQSRPDFPSGDLQPVATEDLACLLFRMTDGAVGALTVSQVSPGRKNRLWIEIDGSQASAAFDEERPESLWLGSRSASQDMTRDSATLAPEARRVSMLPPGHAQGFTDCFAALLCDVYAAIADGRPGDSACYPTFDDGLRVAELTDAVLRSARERAWVKVAP